MTHQRAVFIYIVPILHALSRDLMKKKERGFCEDIYLKQSKNTQFSTSIVGSHQVNTERIQNPKVKK